MKNRVLVFNSCLNNWSYRTSTLDVIGRLEGCTMDTNGGSPMLHLALQQEIAPKSLQKCILRSFVCKMRAFVKFLVLFFLDLTQTLCGSTYNTSAKSPDPQTCLGKCRPETGPREKLYTPPPFPHFLPSGIFQGRGVGVYIFEAPRGRNFIRPTLLYTPHP